MMPRRHISLPLILMALLLTACLKPELTLHFQLTTDIESTYKIIYYSSDKKTERLLESAVTLNQGRGDEKCRTVNPTIIWIFMPGNPNPSIGIYAERGDNIDIRGDKRDPLTWRVGGNDINEQWSEWRIAHLGDLQSGVPEKVNAAVAGYVRSHKNSELSVILMLTSYRREDDEKGYRELWNMIAPDAKNEKILKAIGRADQLTASPVAPSPPVKELKMHCKGETIMTVTPSKFAASLLYMRRGDEYDNSRNIDSLKSLLRRYGGDRRLMIADVSLAQDSMSWLNSIRNDSIEQSNRMLRAWAPGGRMHSSVEMLDISATPWFIVIDSRGQQVYRGKKYGDAAASIRRLLGSPKRETSQ